MRRVFNIAILLIVIFLLFTSPAMGAQYLWQTNAHGNDIHIFELKNFDLIKRLEVGPDPHGIAAPDDSHVVYVALEANGFENGELLWIDPREFEIRHRLQVGLEPHAIATTPDGHWIYIPCRDGNYWVVDGYKKTVVAKINTGDRPHNTQASRDGRYMYLSPIGSSKKVTVVDIQAGHKVVGHMAFMDSLRPAVLSADNSLFFQHVDGLNGFQVADIQKREVIVTVEHKTSPGWFNPIKKMGWITLDGFKRCHGLAIRPDQKEIWSVCAEYLNIHSLIQPDFPETHSLIMEGKGYWLTFAPDSKYGFVALPDRSQVAVVDAHSKRIINHLEVGEGPKRNLVISLSME
jgi:DNA-binding beta-propeller fold protein YncE